MRRWLLLAASIACHISEPTSSPSPDGRTGAAARAPGAAPLPAPENPLGEHGLPLEQQTWLEGSVDEAIPAGGYVYLKVRAPGAPPVWVVSLAVTTPASRHVRVLVLGRAERFTSRRLGRDFSPLLFGAVRAAPDARLPSKGTAS